MFFSFFKTEEEKALCARVKKCEKAVRKLQNTAIREGIKTTLIYEMVTMKGQIERLANSIKWVKKLGDLKQSRALKKALAMKESALDRAAKAEALILHISSNPDGYVRKVEREQKFNKEVDDLMLQLEDDHILDFQDKVNGRKLVNS